MDFISNINNESVLIVPTNLKNDVLNYIDSLDFLINVKIYSLEEIKKKLYFDIDEEAVLYLMEKYGYSHDVSKIYLENLYNVEKKEYNNEKLNFLVSLKEELIKEKLLKYSSVFKNFLMSKEIIIYGYDYLDKFNLRMLKDFNYKVVSKKEFSNKVPVYIFNTLEEELDYVVINVIELIKKGVSPNKIYLLNLDEDYKKEVLKLFKMFNIKVDINQSSSLLSTIIGNFAFKTLKNEKDFEVTIEKISSNFNMKNNNNLEVLNKIIAIFNKYINFKYDFDIVTESIKNDMERTIINNDKYLNMINVDRIENRSFKEDDYVFLLGFNEGMIPRTIKDEKYLSDDLKLLLGFNPSFEINELEKSSLIKNIKSIKNIVITLKKAYKDQEYYPSSLLNYDIFEILKSENKNISYSNIHSSLYLSKMLDDYIKYDYKNPDLEKYYNSFPIRYLEYDNTFKGINSDNLKKFINNELKLSYSTIDNYFRCQFRYYIASVLRLNKFENDLNTYIGNLFHQILSAIYKEDFNLEEEYKAFLSDKKLSNKELFYLMKIKKEINIVIDFIKKFDEVTELKESYLELELSIKKKSEIDVVFKGAIDKIIYKKKNDETLVGIVDYKTGNPGINLELAKHGIGMQLFAYIYLVSKSELFENPNFVGFYLQNILKNEVNIDNKKDYLEQKEKNLRLNGYSTTNKDDLAYLDPTYESSQFITSLRVKKDGEFDSKSKVLSKEEVDGIIDIVDKNIEGAIQNILDANFIINPKRYEQENVGCSYCDFKDICFMTSNDIEDIGGDING